MDAEQDREVKLSETRWKQEERVSQIFAMLEKSKVQDHSGEMAHVEFKKQFLPASLIF